MKDLHGGIDTLFVTMRMDDDDAIANAFYRNIKKYAKKQYHGFGVSFPKGYIAYFGEDKIKGFRNYKKNNIAIGLGLIWFVKGVDGKTLRSIYCLGAHSRIDERVPVISDSSFHSFIRTAHASSDVYSNELRFTSEIQRIEENITFDLVANQFSLSAELF